MTPIKVVESRHPLVGDLGETEFRRHLIARGHGSELAANPGETEDPAGSPERPHAAHRGRGEDQVINFITYTSKYICVADSP